MWQAYLPAKSRRAAGVVIIIGLQNNIADKNQISGNNFSRTNYGKLWSIDFEPLIFMSSGI